MTREEEVAFLAPFFERASVGGVLVVGEIEQALDERLGRKVALASAYNLLHRHGWRKLAPHKRRPRADVATQDARGKNFLTSSAKSTARGRTRGRSA
ncbi:winged helix-turn-helix domain-containing protein [Paraburkholderia fungorum]|uniref:winged helix-turn-helix domain-containing protein n=1 Tax=Paraburkholderia fungorum TaxID=134537 RepID=UPI0038BBF1DB